MGGKEIGFHQEDEAFFLKKNYKTAFLKMNLMIIIDRTAWSKKQKKQTRVFYYCRIIHLKI